MSTELALNTSLLTPQRGRYASPWMDLASQYAPRTFRDALTLCEHLYVNNSVYRKSSERVVSYFLTKVNLTGQADGEIQKFDPVINNDFGIIERLKELGEDYMAYSNAFASLIEPFKRTLKCTQCKNSVNIDFAEFDFQIADMSFRARCGVCRTATRHMCHDFFNPNPKKIRLTRWDPKRITIEYNAITGDANYWLDIDPAIIAKVKSNDRFMISTTPWSFLQAISRGQKYKFNPDYFFHMKEGCIAGLNLGGWGLPSILSSFKDFFRLQVLRRYDEVLMMDYIVPIRVISPAGGAATGGNEMVGMANMNSFRQAFQGAVERHRIDGADYNVFPFPIEYQTLGGEGQQLSPKDLITNEEDRLLNARGMPPELYRGNLTLQVAPVSLRLFERGWTPLVRGLNGATQWMTTTIARMIKSGDITATLESITLADDMEAKNIRLQLMQAARISDETGLAPLGIDSKEEKKRILEEAKETQREQQKAQQEMEMESMNLDTPESDAQGGQSGGGQAGSGSTPMDIQAQGEDIARSLLAPNMTDVTRRQELAKYRNSNPTLHAVIIKAMDKLRETAGLAGRDSAMPQVLSQSQGQQQGAAAGPTPAPVAQ